MKHSAVYKLYFTSFAVALLLLAARQLTAAPSANNQLQAAWQSAENATTYQYATTIEQTTHPLPLLVNNGRTAKTHQMYLEGSLDRTAETMNFQMWTNGGSVVSGAGAIEIKVEDGQAFGRQSHTAWQEIDNVANLFAPGGDPLGFLNAAADVGVSREGSDYDIYTFTIDGLAYATHMRDLMEAQARSDGLLPHGFNYQIQQQYADMVGSGELWIDPANGLPVRQIIHIELPPDAIDQIDATITTTFSNWKEKTSLLPPTLFGQVRDQIAAADTTQMGHTLLTVVLVSALLHAMLNRPSRRLQRGLTISLAFSMLLTPLMPIFRVQRVSAFYEANPAQDPNRDELDDAKEQFAAIAERNEAAGLDVDLARLSTELANDDEEIIDDGTDSDGDRLTDVIEGLLETDPNDADSDDDGLDDRIEVMELGTNPTADDSDGDGLKDKIEVEGFIDGNGVQRYLDPLLQDTNGDGLPDGLECSIVSNALDCPNSDGDSEPDVFDWDNDNDLVPDSVDLAPRRSIGDITNGLADDTFNLSIDNLEHNKITYVDFQLRPTDPDHLWYAFNPLDWPDEDTAGQVTRVFDSTFADSHTGTIKDPRNDNGDMRLVPMLEIEIPEFASRFGTAQTLSEEQYGISFRPIVSGSTTMLAYVPLVLVKEDAQGGAVAFSGRMPYQFTGANWGGDHSVRLTWLVEVKTDSCDQSSLTNPTAEEIEAWCSADDNDDGIPDNWIENGSRIMHTYSDEWYLTGLSVQENQGVSTAVICANPTATRSATSFPEEDLWALSQSLDASFMAGRADGTGQRDMTLADVNARWGGGRGSADQCPNAGIAGKQHNGLNFDGVDDAVTIPYRSEFDTDAFSVGMWLRPQNSPTNATFATWEATTGNPSHTHSPFNFYLLNDLRVVLATRDSACTDRQPQISQQPLIADYWNHVMLVVTGSEHQLYINGSLVSSAAGVGSCSSTGDIVLGRGPILEYAGDLDEFIFYDSALSSDAIANLVRHQADLYDARIETEILVDADLPTASISTTATYLPVNEIVLTVLAEDGTSDITSVKASPSNFGMPQPATRDGDAWLFTFTPFVPCCQLMNGETVPISLEVEDAAGNILQKTQNLRFDEVPPTLGAVNVESSVPSVTRNSVNDSWDLPLSGDVTAVGSPTAEVIVEIRDASGDSVSGRRTATLNGNSWQIDYPFTTRPEGSYTIRIEATDGVGNTSTRTVATPVDGTAPVAQLQYPAPSDSAIDQLTTITGTVSDATGVAGVEVSFHQTDRNDRSTVREFDDGNILHFSLDTLVGTYNDLSGEGNDAACVNCPESAERGKVGNAVRFDGDNDYVTAPDVVDSMTSGSYSFGGWVYADDALGDRPLFGFGDEADTALSNFIVYSTHLRTFYFTDSSRPFYRLTQTFEPEQWIHVWVTYDANSDELKIYINGTQEGSTTTTAEPAAGHDFILGEVWTHNYRSFSGLLDEVAVYDKVLSAAEVNRLYRGFEPVLHLPLDTERILPNQLVVDRSPYDNEVTFSFAGGGGNPYTLNGSGGTSNAAVGAGGYALDGNMDVISVIPQPHLDLSDGEFTQMAWVRTEGEFLGGMVLGGVTDRNNPQTAYPGIAVFGDDVRVEFGDGTTRREYRVNDVLTLSAWNHIATTFDGTTYTIYVNGRPVGSTTDFAGTKPHATIAFQIGARDGFNFLDSLYFEGGLDEIAIYRQVLPPEEIAALYHQGWQSVHLADSGNGVTSTTWGYHVPANLDGSYQIQLRTSDVLGDGGTASFGSQGNIGWEGYIDTTSNLRGAAGLPHEKFMLWLQAQSHTIDATGDVQSWGDLSGNDNHATVVDSDDFLRPGLVENAINGQPVLRFDGLFNFLEIPDDDTLDFDTDESFHIFVVMESDHTSSGGVIAKDAGTGEASWWTRHNSGLFRLLVEQDGGPRPNILSTTAVDTNDPHIILMQRDAAVDEMRIRFDAGAAMVSADTTTQTHANDSPVKIGRFNSGSYPLEGDIAEIIVVRGELSAAEEAAIHNYLSGLYNVPIAVDLYAGDEPAHGDYDYDIAGIGQADGTPVNTAQSGALGLENGETTRAGNIINEDGDYVFIGHAAGNNGESSTNLPAGTQRRWERSWYLDVTEASTPSGDLVLAFVVGGVDTLWLPFEDVSQQQLLYRPNLTTNFTVLATATTLANGQARFTLPASSVTDGYYTLGTSEAVPTSVTVQSVQSETAGSVWLLLTLLVSLSLLWLAWRRREGYM